MQLNFTFSDDVWHDAAFVYHDLDIDEDTEDVSARHVSATAEELLGPFPLDITPPPRPPRHAAGQGAMPRGGTRHTGDGARGTVGGAGAAAA